MNCTPSGDAFKAHPGYSSQGCHLQYTVIPHPYGTSSHGFGCEVNGGHCLPDARCAKLRERFPESIGTGADLMRIYALDKATGAQS